MKLSEAILLGSIGSEQGFGFFSAYKESKAKCVIGAALLAIGIEAGLGSSFDPYYLLEKKWPWTSKKTLSPVTVPPLTTKEDMSNLIVTILWDLNDIQKWTRPQIAAWVASIEPQETLVEQTINQEVYCEVK